RPPGIDVAVSRRMGLYVVGQLARRHNIRVELQNNEDLEGGVTATVRLAGEFVAQLTPNGPMPMPDVRHTADEGRDQLSDSGTHVGLAAAFGRGGVTDRGLSDTTADGSRDQLSASGTHVALAAALGRAGAPER